jgi:hypothetical protein
MPQTYDPPALSYQPKSLPAHYQDTLEGIPIDLTSLNNNILLGLNSPIDNLKKMAQFIYALQDASLEQCNMQQENIDHLHATDPDPCLNVTDKHFVKALCIFLLTINTSHATYSGLQKHCNVLQFWIVCSVALYGMEITLSIIERKYITSFWLSNKRYFTQFESVEVEICPL